MMSPAHRVENHTSRVKSGLGSNVSTCNGSPVMGMYPGAAADKMEVYCFAALSPATAEDFGLEVSMW